MTDLRKVLAFNMKQHRKKLGLSQAKLAEMVDVSDNHIALIETGRRFASLSMLVLLAKALEIDVLELFSIETIKLNEKKNIKEAILADIDHILTIRLLEGE
ncbi:MAG: helix-turn-helix transcriptional regulator [Treponema sp.]|jgi:transcriptional regulator with XRE-family HTH domain|nr:helix-turn-helix transcriptional regulator [Treponema sp.]